MKKTIKLSVLAMVAITIIATSIAFFGSAVAIAAGPDISGVNMSMIGIPQSVAQSAPPAGFSPLTASNQELAQFGFPARPTDPNQLVVWSSIMSHAKTYCPITSVTVGNVTFGSTIEQVSNPYWAGYQIRGQDNGDIQFTGLSAFFNAYYVSTGKPAWWVGIGGDMDDESDGVIAQAGVASGSCPPAGMPNPCLWIENYPAYPLFFDPFTIDSGDNLFVTVSYSSGNAYFVANYINEDTDEYACVVLNASVNAPYYQFFAPNTNVVEFIYEAANASYPTKNIGTQTFSTCGAGYLSGGHIHTLSLYNSDRWEAIMTDQSTPSTISSGSTFTAPY